MDDVPGYAVFFFPPALEVLGEAVKPYLQDGPAGPHIACREVDTAGAFVELTLQGATPEGPPVVVEVMVPANMVRMIVSVRSDTDFGFYDRNRPMVEPGMRAYTLPASPAAASEPAPAVAPEGATKPTEVAASADEAAAPEPAAGALSEPLSDAAKSGN